MIYPHKLLYKSNNVYLIYEHKNVYYCFLFLKLRFLFQAWRSESKAAWVCECLSLSVEFTWVGLQVLRSPGQDIYYGFTGDVSFL